MCNIDGLKRYHEEIDIYLFFKNELTIHTNDNFSSCRRQEHQLEHYCGQVISYITHFRDF